MKNKLTKSDIKLIADKFQWSVKEATSAINEFLEKTSFANSDEILKICIAAKPDERKRKVFEILVNTNSDDLVKHVCNQIVRPDTCFSLLAYFIVSEPNSPLIKFTKIPAQNFGASFYFRKIKSDHILVNPALKRDLVSSLCYEYLDLLLKSKIRQGLNSESLLVDIVSRVGFMAFNIDILKDNAVMYSSFPFNSNKATRLARAIASPLDKKELTQIGYWLNYVIIEKNKEQYSVRRALRKLAEITGQKYNSIQPRYWNRKKIATEEDLTLDDIINKYSLHKYIEDIEQQF